MAEHSLYEIIEHSRERGEGILGVDIGGTNTISDIFLDDKQFTHVLTLRMRTDALRCAEDAIGYALKEASLRKIKIISAGVGVAGPITNGKAKLSNASFSVDQKKLSKTLGIGVSLLNDFEAQAYALNVLSGKDLLPLNKAQIPLRAKKCIIGAGTGLGKASLLYDTYQKRYVPLPSEQGHTLFAAANEEEFKLLEFLREEKKKEQICWEDVLSGRGIVSLYDFAILQGCKSQKKNQIRSAPDKSDAISFAQTNDAAAGKAFSFLSRFYGRFGKDCALSDLCSGGLYISGGIARKNPEILRSSEFREEFIGNEVMKSYLQKIPLFLVLDSHAGTKGAAYFSRTARKN